jgi:hypothetical protein
MNLYLVLALALSAISGVVEAPSAARPVLSTLAARRDRRDYRRAIRARLAAPRRVHMIIALVTRLLRRCEAPLTGGAATRAPALG